MDKLGKELMFFDGGMGTLLQAQGLDVLPEIWNVTNADAIFAIHKAYANAGCNIIKANTFGANRLKLEGSGYTPAQLISAGIGLAKKAASECGGKAPTREYNASVALDIGSTGKLLAPVGDLPFEEAIDIFAEMVRAGVEAGADLILIETMSDTYEIKAAMLAAKENSDLPIMVTFSPDEKGRLLTGADILTAATLVESLGACAVGLNCGFGPLQMTEHLKQLCAAVQIPVIFNPNGGMPKIIDGKTVFDLAPADFAAQMKQMQTFGVSVLGGCCGTTPEHIGEMVELCTQNLGVKGTCPLVGELGATPPRSSTRVTSFAKTVTLGGELVIIGERINPTGKPKLKKALLENDFDFIRNEALTQIGQGAKLLDVNVGLPDIDEEKMLCAAVREVQGITDTPLVIDTSDVAAAEAALRVYNGKPLLNSVNGKKESLEAVLPLAKKYGAAVVALALDDNGIPETAAGRVAIAERIIAAAAAHGIPKHDIVVDALTMTLSTNTQNAQITLDAVAELTQKTGVCTVLGVSNISFGLPQREKLNTGFLTLAANSGLSAAIANPANEATTDAISINKILSGKDTDCAEYVQKYAPVGEQSTAKPASVSEQKTRTLYDSVIAGMENEAKKATQALLENTAPMEIINENLIPALNTAGETFAAGKTFLPQLLKSAAAATAAFDTLRAHMTSKGENTEKRGKIVLATVKGDIHDIGKNIVKTLLENYNFEVFDLGKNVEPSEILQTVQRENAPLVGLSALMTTTVASMEETITLLRAHAPTCKIMVGGAVLTAEHAKKIGADFYSPDAMGAVRYAEENL
ncbi:MAG: homocysteine S-methyltransferase family protein [Defluviitaleaceae bacterium]|nr:homocysteine S-methyltransferase family protein [Defluviitaleaceae bacterium]MCL2263705.1 homocysteine S-methyltransferase family protein [Defluviitaleaceae bacterium]